MTQPSSQPGQSTPRTQESNAWTSATASSTIQNVQDTESFPSLDTPMTQISAKAYQDESFGKVDGAKRQRPKRRNNPRRDLKRLNGMSDDKQSLDQPGMPSDGGHMHLPFQNGHGSHDDTMTPQSNGSPGRFENVFDDNNGGFYGGGRRNDYNNGHYRQRRNNRRRGGYRNHDDRYSGDRGDAHSPRSGSQETDESSRRHPYNRRRHHDGRRFRRDNPYRHNGDRWRGNGHNGGRRDNYTNGSGRNRSYENGGSSGMDGPPMSAGSAAGMGFSGPPSAGIPGTGPMGFGGPGMVGQQFTPPQPTGNPNDFVGFGMGGIGAFPQQGWPVGFAPQMYSYPQAASFGVVPQPMSMYPQLAQPMVMVPNFPFPGVDASAIAQSTGPTQTEGVVPSSNGDATKEGLVVMGQSQGELQSQSEQAPPQKSEVLSDALLPSEPQRDASDMINLSDATAGPLMGMTDGSSEQTRSGEASQQDEVSAASDPSQTQGVTPGAFGDGSAIPGYPADMSMMVQPMFGIPPMWSGFASVPVAGLGMVGGIPTASSDPAYDAHITKQSSQVPVTDTGTHFPAHGEELEIPRGPYFCVKVACVATGNRHDDRDVGQVVVVDFNLNVRCNIYVKSEHIVVSYLDPLTSLEDGDWIEKFGLPLKEAERIVKETIPVNAVIVGQNVVQDLNWLNMKRGEHYRSSIDLRDLWRIWSPRFRGWTHFSLEHQAICILHHSAITKHNAPLDANLTMRLFIAYMSARALKSGTKLQDLRELLRVVTQQPSFSRQNPVFEGVCMGNKRYCRCGAPALTQYGGMPAPRTSQSAGTTPVTSPTATRAPLEIQSAPEVDAPPASAPTTSSIVPPTLQADDNEINGEKDSEPEPKTEGEEPEQPSDTQDE